VGKVAGVTDSARGFFSWHALENHAVVA
jgi:hypothetical protein